MPQDPLDPHPDVDNDGLSLAQTAERATWGLPSDEGAVGQEPARLPGGGFDYAAGILVGHGEDADAQAAAHHRLIRARVDVPPSFQLPHEATHRRFEPPRLVVVNQAAAGFTLLAAPNQGLHFVKLLGLVLSLDAAGTLKFVQGPQDGTGISAASAGSDLSGNIQMGNAAEAPLVLPVVSELANPWLFTSPDQALGIFTVTGKAQGWAMVAYSPYET